MPGRRTRACCRNGSCCRERGECNGGGGAGSHASRRDMDSGDNRYHELRHYLAGTGAGARNPFRLNPFSQNDIQRSSYPSRQRISLPLRYSPFWPSSSDYLLARASTSSSGAIGTANRLDSERPISPTHQQEPEEELPCAGGNDEEQVEGNRGREMEITTSSDDEQEEMMRVNRVEESANVDQNGQRERFADEDSDDEFIRVEEGIRSPSPSPPPQDRGNEDDGVNQGSGNIERIFGLGGIKNNAVDETINIDDNHDNSDDAPRTPGSTPPASPTGERSKSPSEMAWVDTAPIDNIFAGPSSSASGEGLKTFTSAEDYSERPRLPSSVNNILTGYYNKLLEYANNPSQQNVRHPLLRSEAIKETTDRLLKECITPEAVGWIQRMAMTGNRDITQSSSSLPPPTPYLSFFPGPNMYPHPLQIYCSYSKCIHSGYAAVQNSPHSPQEGTGTATPEGFGSLSVNTHYDASPGTSKKTANFSQDSALPSGSTNSDGKLLENRGVISPFQVGEEKKNNSVITTTFVNGVCVRKVRNFFDHPPVQSAFALAPPPLLSPIREPPKSSRKDDEPIDESLPLSPYSAATEDVRRYREIGRADAEREIATIMATVRQSNAMRNQPQPSAVGNVIAGPSGVPPTDDLSTNNLNENDLKEDDLKADDLNAGGMNMNDKVGDENIAGNKNDVER